VRYAESPSDDDDAFLDRSADHHRTGSQTDARTGRFDRPRSAELASDYEAAWSEWASVEGAAEDAEAWEATAGDVEDRYAGG
jgi:hypothetical protein